MPIYTCPHCECESEARDMTRRRSRNSYQARQSAAPPGSARYRLWQCMRQLRCFTQRDLAATAETPVNSAAVYVGALVKSGYVRVAANPQGQPGSYKQFQLVRNTGPNAPRWRKGVKAIYDANLKVEVPFV